MSDCLEWYKDICDGSKAYDYALIARYDSWDNIKPAFSLNMYNMNGGEKRGVCSALEIWTELQFTEITKTFADHLVATMPYKKYYEDYVAVSKEHSCAKYILHRYYGKYFLLGFLYDSEIDGARIDRLHALYQKHGYVKSDNPFEVVMKNVLNNTGKTINEGEPVANINTDIHSLHVEISNLKKAVHGLSEKNRDLKKKNYNLRERLAKQQVMLSNLTWHMKSCTQVCQHTKDIIEKMDKVINEE